MVRAYFISLLITKIVDAVVIILHVNRILKNSVDHPIVDFSLSISSSIALFESSRRPNSVLFSLGN